MFKHIRNIKLRDFWANTNNRSVKILFIQKDVNYPDYSDTEWLVGMQDLEMYKDSQYWDILFNTNSIKEAKKYSNNGY